MCFFYRQSKLRRIQEERDKLEERVHALEYDKQNQQTKTEVVVLSQQMEALEKVNCSSENGLLYRAIETWSEKNWMLLSKMMVSKRGSASLKRFSFLMHV